MVSDFVHFLGQIVHGTLLKVNLALNFSYFFMHAPDHNILRLTAINSLNAGAYTEFLISTVLQFQF